MAIQTPVEVVETATDELLPQRVGRARLSPTPLYFARRFGLYLVTLWGAFTASFVFFRLIPGDPIGAIVSQLESQGQYGSQGGSEAIVAYYRKEFGLDGSILTQYVRYLNQIVVHHNFGPSIVSYPTPAQTLIFRALPWTLGLLGTSVLLGWVLGVMLGAFVGWARNSRIAGLITNVALLFSHVPAYFIALFLLFFLSYRLGTLPPNSAYDANLSIGWSGAFVASVVKHAVIPVMATAFVGACNWLITTRTLVVSILGEDYLTYAGAKGLSSPRILFRYVLRNAWLPQVTALGITIGAVINGNVLVERLFRYPGLGNLLVDSILVKDVNTAQGIIVLLIFLVLTLNLIIDLCLPLFDPRVKYRR
jgi:peptide/nickel transport system permease protein